MIDVEEVLGQAGDLVGGLGAEVHPPVQRGVVEAVAQPRRWPLRRGPWPSRSRWQVRSRVRMRPVPAPSSSTPVGASSSIRSTVASRQPRSSLEGDGSTIVPAVPARRSPRRPLAVVERFVQGLPVLDARAPRRGTAPRRRPAAGRPDGPPAPRRRPAPLRGGPGSDRLDLAGLDADAADLDLVVGAAEELRRAVRRHLTRSPVRYIRAPGGPYGSAMKRSRRAAAGRA